MSLEKNFNTVRERINSAAKQYHRDPNTITLLAASKTQTLDTIKQAYALGQRHFGENYLQEALQKIEGCHASQLEDIQWHFIGHIQSNKTHHIAENFHWVHSIERVKIAKRLHDQRPFYMPPLNICIEINIDEQPTKCGVLLEDVEDLLARIKQYSRIVCRGLMAMPKPRENFEEQHAPYHRLKNKFDELNKKGYALDTLSMGMTNDLEAAVAEGATIVRVGTALFGKREEA